MDLELLVRTITGEVLRQIAAPRLRVRVLGQRDAAVAQAVAERLGENVTVVFAGENDAAVCDRHILPTLTCSDMADLAVGRASQDLAPVLHLLLQGKTVQALEFQSHAYAQSAPQTLFALYATYEKQLAAYGLTLLPPRCPERVRVRERLITDSTVREAQARGATTLLVAANAVVTPLAAETAAALHLQILKPA